MDILTFIFYTLLVLCSTVVIIGVVGIVNDTTKLKEENEKLKKQVYNARYKRMKQKKEVTEDVG